jgi:endonuclease III
MTYIKSGSIWKCTNKERVRTVVRVCELLEAEYGCPRLGNPHNPVDDLVYIMLSNKTSPKISKSIYLQLKAKYRNWYQFLDAPISCVRRIMLPGGLAKIKSNQIRSALRRIEKNFGRLRLEGLKNFSVEDAEAYLKTLPGVSEKVAKCVMMYTLGFDVLPVDRHVHRIAARLGWTCRKRADQCHPELEALVQPNYRYAFHVSSICHGRLVCTSIKPDCNACILRRHCNYYLTNAQDT